jgi:hypothetical protein
MIGDGSGWDSSGFSMKITGKLLTMDPCRRSDRGPSGLGASHEAHKIPTSPGLAELTTEAPRTKRDDLVIAGGE